MSTLTGIGRWRPDTVSTLGFSSTAITHIVSRCRETTHVVRDRSTGHVGVAIGGQQRIDAHPTPATGDCDWLATLPPLYPEWLGDRSFAEAHGVEFPYIAGEMAGGIASTRMVIALGKEGLLGVFGAAGLRPAHVETALDELAAALGPRGPWGINLIHSPSEPEHEDALAARFIARDVPCVSLSAFMGLTPAVVRLAVAGLTRDASGRVCRRRRVLAKVSRPEVATHFMSPAPDAMLQQLLGGGLITADEAMLSRCIPLAEDITVEADSGGHTDNRPLSVILPRIIDVRDQLVARYGYDRNVRVGAAGGLGTPAAVAGAFALGAAYVVTGSINQGAVESGLSSRARAMLAKADIADVAMAPSADMFELGVKVQVLKHGTLFAARASRLYELFTRHDSLAAIEDSARLRLERDIFGKPLEAAVAETRAFWQQRDPAQLARADRDPKHEMALVFRSYLGLASRWAIAGDETRQADYQIWCGPAMGAFNRWVANSFLELPESRGVVQIARNLLEGAAVITRAHQLRTHGVNVPTTAFTFAPRPLERE